MTADLRQTALDGARDNLVDLQRNLLTLAPLDEDAAHDLVMELLRWCLTRPGAIFATQDPTAGYLVILDGRVKDEAAHQTLNALCMMRGVAAVERVPADVQQAIATETARVQLERKLWDAIRR